MSDFVDTIMNIEIFTFLGVLVWLYLKPSALDEENEVERDQPEQQA